MCFLQVWIIIYIYILCYVCLYVYVYVFIWLYVLSLFFGRLHLGSLACAPLFFGQVEPGHWWQQIALSHARISNLELIQVLHSLGLRENLNRKPCFSHENHGTWWFRILGIMGFTMEFSLGFTDWSNKRRPGQLPIVRGNSSMIILGRAYGLLDLFWGHFLSTWSVVFVSQAGWHPVSLDAEG